MNGRLRNYRIGDHRERLRRARPPLSEKAHRLELAPASAAAPAARYYKNETIRSQKERSEILMQRLAG
jgi:hypothetical protein